jgi:hypothetical protein
VGAWNLLCKKCRQSPVDLDDYGDPKNLCRECEKEEKRQALDADDWRDWQREMRREEGRGE